MNERWHFIGVGGCGMSGLAKVLLEQGFPVSGSDQVSSAKTDQLIQKGIDVFIGHSAAYVGDDVGTVVVSTAIRPDNPEWMAAIARGIPVLHRSQCLAQLTQKQKTIGIAGAHGKTTTTSMLATILLDARRDPTVVVGGYMDILEGNGLWGTGDYLVAEADESDGSFLNLHTFIPMVTNIEDDHLDHYGTIESIQASFRKYVATGDPRGFAVLNTDCSRTRTLAQGFPKAVTYGFREDTDFQAVNVRTADGFNVADIREKKTGRTETIQIYMPGRHNIQNALGAYACARSLGIDADVIARSLAGYKGVGRRFQRIGASGDITVVDDYAHHPTEIEALLKGARTLGTGRIVVAFQPHRYTRTRQLLGDFARVMGLADVALVSDVYSAGEDMIPGADSPALVQEAARDHVFYTGDLNQTLDVLAEKVQPGDLVLTIGAGDVTTLGPRLLERLAKHG